jgi:hypothetical protein
MAGFLPQALIGPFADFRLNRFRRDRLPDGRIWAGRGIGSSDVVCDLGFFDCAGGDLDVFCPSGAVAAAGGSTKIMLRNGFLTDL